MAGRLFSVAQHKIMRAAVDGQIQKKLFDSGGDHEGERRKGEKQLIERLNKAESDILNRGDYSSFNDLVREYGLKTIENLKRKSGQDISYAIDKRFDPLKSLIKERNNAENPQDSNKEKAYLSFKSSNGSFDVHKSIFHHGVKDTTKDSAKNAMDAATTRLEESSENIITSSDGAIGNSHKASNESFDVHKSIFHHHRSNETIRNSMDALDTRLNEFSEGIITSSDGAIGKNIDSPSENEQNINKNDITEDNKLNKDHRYDSLSLEKYKNEFNIPKFSGKRGHDSRKFRLSLRRQARPGLSILRGKTHWTTSKGSISHGSLIGGSPHGLRAHDPVRERLGRKSQGTWKPLDVTRSTAKLREEMKGKINKGLISKSMGKLEKHGISMRNIKDIKYHKEDFSNSMKRFENIMREEKILKLHKHENKDGNHKKENKNNMKNEGRNLLKKIHNHFHTMKNNMRELMKSTDKNKLEENADRFLREEHGKLGANLKALDKLEKDGYEMDENTKGFTHKVRKVYDFMNDHIDPVDQQLKQYHPGEVVMQLLEQYSEVSLPEVENNAKNDNLQTGNLLSNDLKGVGNKFTEKIEKKLGGKKQGESSQDATDPEAGNEKAKGRRRRAAAKTRMSAKASTSTNVNASANVNASTKTSVHAHAHTNSSTASKEHEHDEGLEHLKHIDVHKTKHNELKVHDMEKDEFVTKFEKLAIAGKRSSLQKETLSLRQEIARELGEGMYEMTKRSGENPEGILKHIRSRKNGYRDELSKSVSHKAEFIRSVKNMAKNADDEGIYKDFGKHVYDTLYNKRMSHEDIDEIRSMMEKDKENIRALIDQNRNTINSETVKKAVNGWLSSQKGVI
jgi:hypothetical protein